MNHLEDTLDARWVTRTFMVEYIMKQDDNEILFDSMLLQVVQNGENNITSRFFVNLIRHMLPSLPMLVFNTKKAELLLKSCFVKLLVPIIIKEVPPFICSDTKHV